MLLSVLLTNVLLMHRGTFKAAARAYVTPSAEHLLRNCWHATGDGSSNSRVYLLPPSVGQRRHGVVVGLAEYNILASDFKAALRVKGLGSHPCTLKRHYLKQYIFLEHRSCTVMVRMLIFER